MKDMRPNKFHQLLLERQTRGANLQRLLVNRLVKHLPMKAAPLGKVQNINGASANITLQQRLDLAGKKCRPIELEVCPGRKGSRYGGEELTRPVKNREVEGGENARVGVS